MEKRIFIIGVKHCGKSTVGKELSKSLQLPFFDLDELIEDNVKQNVRSFFKENGKEKFQEKETEALLKLNKEKGGFICATGGGICDNQKAFEVLKDRYNVYINTNFETVFKRISKNGTPAFLKSDNPKLEFKEIFIKRNLLYKELSKIEINGNNNSPLEIRDKIIEELRS